MLTTKRDMAICCALLHIAANILSLHGWFGLLRILATLRLSAVRLCACKIYLHFVHLELSLLHSFFFIIFTL